ncbi:MAG: disulfide oxidoreductase [Rhodospirillales bacterium]|nr:disulfide oxidoreductase [Rhodospirillales bacterium]
MAFAGRVPTENRRVTAVLGPTNTGKTHLALERMLAHPSGVIGFPLRLLARENYDRAVALTGRGQVALVTGEEKIVPPGARYFVCTVESMPLDRPFEFLAGDEIQMCADADRGHVFTDRLLRARGTSETMVMGAETIRPLLRRLVPQAEFAPRRRFSTLAYTGSRKIARLAPRSAVVAFSAADVYAIAELVRRNRGGAAVVLGALSPRTRNAQVAMYQAGEVDYLVATDAIGMGLNMDIDHVAFAALRKFDGRNWRALGAAELAQTAGRAGRHMNDGTFGTTAEVGPLDEETVERIENHRFDPLPFLFWRNSDLDFASLARLQRSLTTPPPLTGLRRAHEAQDELALAPLGHDPDVVRVADAPERVRLLWAICQVPDFRKVMSEAHARFLKRLFLYLAGAEARLPADWVADQIARLDRTDGDMEMLIQRIANIRTWTYVAYQPGWLADPGPWQGRARAVEDRLSDALHERLTQRFVDRRTALLVSRLRDSRAFIAAVARGGRVTVEGETVGRLEGFRFVADAGSETGDPRRGAAEKTIAGAVLRALRGEAAARVRALEQAADGVFAFGPGGGILWQGAPVARLQPGPTPFAPQVAVIGSELLEGGEKERIRRRLAEWMKGAVQRVFAPLFAAHEAAARGPMRGLVFQLAEGFGSLPRARASAQIEALTREDRRNLARRGIVLGRETVFMPVLLKPGALDLRARLWTAQRGLAAPPPAPPAGRTWVRRRDENPASADFLEALGFRVLGSIAVRADILERIAARAWTLAKHGPFVPPSDLLNLAGCGPDDLAVVLAALGFERIGQGEASAYRPRRRRKEKDRIGPSRARRAGRGGDSPFAVLGDMAGKDMAGGARSRRR